MLESIRSALYKKSLHRVLATQKRSRQAHNFSSAKKIGILFVATAEKTRHEVMDYAKKLVEKGKSVRLFGYFKTKQPPEGHAFNFFFQKVARRLCKHGVFFVVNISWRKHIVGVY